MVAMAFWTFWLKETPWMTRPDKSTVTRWFGWNTCPPPGNLRDSLSRSQRRPAPALPHRELGNGLARELRQLAHGAPERHDCAHSDVPRNAEQRLYLRLLGGGERGHGAPEALVARRHEHVPCKRVDRRAAHDTHALEILVHRRDNLQIDADDQHHRGRGNRLGQVLWRRSALDGGGVDAGRVDGVPRALPVRRLRCVALGGEAAEIGQRALRGGVADHNDAPTLAIAAAGSEARVVEDRAERFVGHRVSGELARGKSPPHHVEELHHFPPAARSGDWERGAVMALILPDRWRSVKPAIGPQRWLDDVPRRVPNRTTSM